MSGSKRKKVILSVAVNNENSTHREYFDEIMDHHEVGGWYITAKECTLINDVMTGKLPPRALPCRFADLGAYFVKPEEAIKGGTFNINRMSFRMWMISLETLKYNFDRRPDGRHAMMVFLDRVLEEAEIKSERFILDNCYRLDICEEHECCRKVFGREQNRLTCIRLACCNNEDCKDFTNFNEQFKKEDVARIEKYTILTD